MADVAMLKPDKMQRTLFSLAKVVRLESGSVMFSADSIEKLKQSLLDTAQTKHQLLTVLRKLDCYKLQDTDLQSTGIGEAVATLASLSPKPEVARLASVILDKWHEMMKLTTFKPLESYDLEAAAAADEGEPEAPQDEIAAIKMQKRLDKLERRRQRDLDMLADMSSSDDEEEEEEDPDWAPQQPAARLAGLQRRSSRRSRGSQGSSQGTIKSQSQSTINMIMNGTSASLAHHAASVGNNATAVGGGGATDNNGGVVVVDDDGDKEVDTAAAEVKEQNDNVEEVVVNVEEQLVDDPIEEATSI